MGLEETVRKVILSDPTVLGLVAQRVYPDVIPQTTTAFPAITYQYISRVAVADHLNGPGSLARPRVQIDSWAKTRAEAVSVGRAVKRRLNGFKGQVPDEGEVQRIALDTMGVTYDPEVLLYRHKADYFVWHEEV